MASKEAATFVYVKLHPATMEYESDTDGKICVPKGRITSVELRQDALTIHAEGAMKFHLCKLGDLDTLYELLCKWLRGISVGEWTWNR